MPNAQTIKSMFNNISVHYDLLNDILSLGIHRLWKKALVKEMTKNSPQKILDCATGTGDIAIMMKHHGPNSQILGTDFSANMLSVAKKKTNEITWEVQDVMNLPYADDQFDCSSISYGIRNVEDYHLALKEMARVTSTKICILEFGQPQNPLFKFVYFTVMKGLMPIIGKLFNKQQAYKYLIESSMNFPSQQEFCDVIKASTGFDKVTYQPFFGGVTYLYIASNN
ncbi:MAG: bifunctional demethylmenaquinone methyltransferase/2-methoxy-6-polyprenyl-1,4-benzoquinol methylase UbiE [Halobacteriovoraceae bacterium]|jgi:demethylmenaquinone methyltransferase / 2-methoxy-6-polyprenyl-1,4-benzoquinol methylase|nr:bifunctional demethylmenaquinone methyltransferase/2-methoxy-6-polyprenyl-1,4-benzoquinol methylase UbiE [Halobacteriovoraceae bacterium]